MRGTKRLIHMGVPGGVVAALPFSDTFDTNKSGWTGPTWLVSGGVITNTPGIGDEMVLNGDFASATGWTPQAGWTIGSGVATGNNPNTSVINTGGTPPAAGGWYQVAGALTRTAGSAIWQVGSASSATKTLTGAVLAVLRATTTNVFRVFGSSLFQGTVDNVTCKRLTLATLFHVRNARSANVTVSIDVTLTAELPAGIVVCLDNPANSANFVIAYLDGTNAKVDKCVAGTYANVISGAVAYTAGGTLEITIDAGAVTLTYKSIEVGTGVIADAGIISNIYHGLFSTHSNNTLDNFVMYAAGSEAPP